MGARRSIVTVVLLAAALLVPSVETAHAYQFGPPRWRNPNQLTYAIRTSGTYRVPAWLVPHMDDAAEAWTSTPTPLVVKRGASNIVIQGYSSPDGNGGFTRCTSISSDGFCTHSEIWMNYDCHYVGGGNYACGTREGTPRFNKYVAMHEFGHAFGMGHSGHPNAVMSQSSCPGEANCPLAPHRDDVDGINARYGYNQGGGSGGSGCSSIQKVEQEVAQRTQQQSANQSANQVISAIGNVTLTGLNLADATIGKIEIVRTTC